MNMIETMAYARKRMTRKRPALRRKATKKTGALAIAKKALRLAAQTTKSVTETKYLSYSGTTDLANGASFGGSAFWYQPTNLNGTTPLFNSDPVTGNKAFYKYLKGTWEIHMDSANNEEETCNFTVAVIKYKSDADYISGDISQHISVIQGQTYFDPRVIKVLYYKHFTRTMGGTSPGTAGESTRVGHFYIPIKKMVRFIGQGNDTQQNSSSQPASLQDRIFFAVFTDNSSVDFESPRLNWRTMMVVEDVDANQN